MHPYKIAETRGKWIMLDSPDTGGGPFYPAISIDEDNANAQFIVTACNCHDDLSEACEAVLPAIRWGMTHLPGNMNQWRDCESQIEAAIAKTKEV